MKRASTVYVTALAVMLAPATSWALLISYGVSTSGLDGPLKAEADFTTSSGLIELVLTNTLSNAIFKSPGQGLSDITFTLSNAPGTLGTHTASGQFGDLSTTPVVVTYVASDSGTSPANTTPVRWYGTGGGFFQILGNDITLETIGGGQPSEMIAPFIADGGTYTSGNNGLTNFNAWVIGPATFDIALSGVTADTTVTAVTFSFGTSPDTFSGDTIIPENGAPEPATLGLLGLGLAALGLSRKRTR